MQITVLNFVPSPWKATLIEFHFFSVTKFIDWKHFDLVFVELIERCFCPEGKRRAECVLGKGAKDLIWIFKHFWLKVKFCSS